MKKKELTIEKIRAKIDSIIEQSYSYVNETTVDPMLSVEDIDTISDLLVCIERKLNKTILPERCLTHSEVCLCVQKYRLRYDDITYVEVLKRFIYYFI